MKELEIWLCKVLVHPPPAMRRALKLHELNEDSHQRVMARIIGGELGTLPDGSIIEPITAHRTEVEANAARERATFDDPAGDYRVVVVMGVVPS